VPVIFDSSPMSRKLRNIHAVTEFGVILREPFEPAQSSPAALDAQAELVDHREHSVAGQTSFRAIGPVAHGGEARLDHVRAADVDRNHLRVMTIAGAVERQFLAAQWSPRTSAFVGRDRQLRVVRALSDFRKRPVGCNLAHVSGRNPAMTACTEFCSSRRIQRTAAYKVLRPVGQKIANGEFGSIAPIRFLKQRPFDECFARL
jgi:hypothetical protein